MRNVLSRARKVCLQRESHKDSPVSSTPGVRRPSQNCLQNVIYTRRAELFSHSMNREHHTTFYSRDLERRAFFGPADYQIIFLMAHRQADGKDSPHNAKIVQKSPRETEIIKRAYMEPHRNWMLNNCRLENRRHGVHSTPAVTFGHSCTAVAILELKTLDIPTGNTKEPAILWTLSRSAMITATAQPNQPLNPGRQDVHPSPTGYNLYYPGCATSAHKSTPRFYVRPYIRYTLRGVNFYG